MTVECFDLKKSKPKTYVHEQHLIINAKGKRCLIRCAFDDERFFLRSVAYIGKAGTHIPIKTFTSMLASEVV